MGLLEYAWAISFQKDDVKTRIRLEPTIQQPTLRYDESGYNVYLPIPRTPEENIVTFLGNQFTADTTDKIKIGRLFRACVYHLTTHTLMPRRDQTKSLLPKPSVLEAFSESMVNDLFVNAYFSALHPDRLADFAFANALSFLRLKPCERIFVSGTRIMAALVSMVNVGLIRGVLSSEEQENVNHISAKLDSLRRTIVSSFKDPNVKFDEDLGKAKDAVACMLEANGLIFEAPSLPYTERIGPCSVFSSDMKSSQSNFEEIFKMSLKVLGGAIPNPESMDSCWRKEQDIEAIQAFESELHQKARQQRILSKLEEYWQNTRFKYIGFPEEDYTQYLRSRVLLGGGSRRLLDTLRVAQDALDEDPGKEMGQLDLTAVIQMLSSRKPATDVFMKDEYLSKSFAWGILLDVSASMKVEGEFARALVICVAEATKELLQDSSSWGLYAFSDSFYILKAPSEAYTRRVRARIGGLKFGGLTYMPDAIQIAGRILTTRFDEQRFLIVASDGWPYGYQNIDASLSETIAGFERKGINVIGIGVETDRMKNFFKLSSTVHNQRDLIKGFAKVYTDASAKALET
jgi:hypothetical protein